MSLISWTMIAVIAIAIGGGIWGGLEEEYFEPQKKMSNVAWEEITKDTHDCWTWIYNKDAQIGYCQETGTQGGAKDKFLVYADFSRQVSNKRYSNKIFRYSLIDSIKYDQKDHKLELKLNEGRQKFIRVKKQSQEDQEAAKQAAWKKALGKRKCTPWAKSSDEFIGICTGSQKFLYAELNEKFSTGMSDDRILKFHEVKLASNAYVEGSHEIVISLKDGRVKKIKRNPQAGQGDEGHKIQVTKNAMGSEWGPQVRIDAIKKLNKDYEINSNSCLLGEKVWTDVWVIKCRNTERVSLPMKKTEWRFAWKRS